MGDARRGVRLINWTIFKVFFFKLALSALGAEPFPNAREMSRSYDISLRGRGQVRHSDTILALAFRFTVNCDVLLLIRLD